MRWGREIRWGQVTSALPLFQVDLSVMCCKSWLLGAMLHGRVWYGRVDGVVWEGRGCVWVWEGVVSVCGGDGWARYEIRIIIETTVRRGGKRYLTCKETLQWLV